MDAALGDSLVPDDLDTARGLRFAAGVADTTLGDLEIDEGVELVLLTRHPVLDAKLIVRLRPRAD